MHETAFETAMQDVAKAYRNPANLLADEELSRAQKLKLLQQWDYDLGLLLVAAEENMSGPGASLTAERLRSVREAIKCLGVEPDPEDPHAAAPSGKVAGVAIPDAAVPDAAVREPSTKLRH
ncbi:hypothetical protein [Dongia sp.]|uniref:hypothetical protein n=1 Tax=Dongia sp. TaxID=1977262 RepID=UPI0035AED227